MMMFEKVCAAIEMDKFWLQVDKGDADECWPFRGEVWRGYGRYWTEGRRVRAHRYAFQLTSGIEVPEGLKVLHECDNPICCNPSHLFLGTSRDNTQDMIRKGRSPVVGVKHPWLGGATKLTPEIVKEIRLSKESGRVLALKYGVSESAVSRARRYISWCAT